MRCLILFRDALGHLPTAQDLLECGFHVSEAVLLERDVEALCIPLARAAEQTAVYGNLRGASAPEQGDVSDRGK